MRGEETGIGSSQVPIGGGVNADNIRKVLQFLAETKWDGVVSIECHGSDENMKASVEFPARRAARHRPMRPQPTRRQMMTSAMNRRTFVQHSVLASAGAALAMGGVAQPTAARAADPAPPPATPTTTAEMPRGKIKDLEISRLLLGGNLLTHFTHSRDLRVRLLAGQALQHAGEDPRNAGRRRRTWRQYAGRALRARDDRRPPEVP